jgi:hypothetical protein
VLGKSTVTSDNRLQLTSLFFPILKLYVFPFFFFFLRINNCWRPYSNTYFNPAFVLMAVNRYLYSSVCVCNVELLWSMLYTVYWLNALRWSQKSIVMWGSLVTIQETRCNRTGHNYKFYDRRNAGAERT